jgi:hypothetical protein
LESPGCDAVMVQEPAPVIVTVADATVQLPLALKLTVNYDDAVAVNPNGGSPYVFDDSDPNVMV